MNDAHIPEEIINKIKDDVDLVEIIGMYLSLKKSGQNYKGLCPFHSEKTPSFMVNPVKRIYHCFGCGNGGNAFTFLMKMEGYSFSESVIYLAEKRGININLSNRSLSKEKDENDSKEILFKINKLASEIFHQQLLNHTEAKKAREYLTNRGITEEYIKEFNIGYAISSWDNILKTIVKSGFTPIQLEKLGLIIPKSSGGYYDRFRGRIIFPILSLQKKVIGFGGRVIDDSLPKYINSPESILYSKGKNLFCLEKVRGDNAEIKNNINSNPETIFVVEGYIDAITVYQSGIKNVVATLGTALTSYHIELIKRFSQEVILVFDSDKAGINAATRTLEPFMGSGLSVKVIELPKGYDPDVYIRENGKERFLNLLQDAKDLFLYVVNNHKKEIGINDINNKIKIVNEIIPIISKVSNNIEKDDYLIKLADELKIDDKILRNELERLYPDNKQRLKIDNSTPQVNYFKSDLPKEEEIIVHLMLNDKFDIGEIKEKIKIDDITDNILRKIVEVIFQSIEKFNKIDHNFIFREMDKDIERTDVISRLLLKELEYDDIESTINDCLRKLRLKKISDASKEIEKKIKNIEKKGNVSDIRDLQLELLTLKKSVLQR